MQYQVQLDEFKGPLPLLLELIEKRKLDVTSVSLAKVTDDFLAYLKEREEVSLQNLAEFLFVASQLILIKSKVLLPFFELTAEEEEDIKELEERLREYKKFKKAARQLGRRWQQQRIAFCREQTIPIQVKPSFPPLEKTELAKALTSLLKRDETPAVLAEETIEKTISLEEKLASLKKSISQRVEISFRELVKNSQDKAEVVVSFLAILEMLKQRFITVRQEGAFGEISIKRLSKL